MRVIVAGASGAVGWTLVPQLLQRGHRVLGMSRSAEGAAKVAGLGAEAKRVDALDARAVRDAVLAFKPEAVIHQLTALPQSTDLRDFDGVFAQTNRLRIHGTDNLIAAARETGTRRFVAQSYCGWPFARTGGPVKTEDDPLDPNPPKGMRRSFEAIVHLERAVTAASDIGGVVLRYGGFYGPGTMIARDSPTVLDIRKRKWPVVGRGGGIWSFIHIGDAASAAVAAVEAEATGIFNIVDDEPAPVAEWLPALASAVGAKSPWRVPAFLARLLLPEHLYVMMTEVRGGSNAKAKRVLGWRPAFASWRDGFRRGLG
jgi:2-alkyl-3-oxoalkanoate reductase